VIMKIDDKKIDKIVYSISAILIFTTIHFQFPEFILKIDVTNRFVVSNILIYQGIYYLVIPTLIYILIQIWKPFKKRFIELINIIYLTVIVFVISFPIAYQILNLGKELSKIPSVQIGSSNGWLSFIGSIFGGLITLIALIFTLNHQNRTREEIERVSQFPLIGLETFDLNSSLNINVPSPIKLNIKVLGNNSIKNLELKWKNLKSKSKINYLTQTEIQTFVDVNLTEEMINKFESQKFSINYLPMQSDIELKLDFPIEPIVDDFIINEQEHNYSCECIYENIIKTKRFIFTATLLTTIYVFKADSEFKKSSITRIITQNIEEI